MFTFSLDGNTTEVIFESELAVSTGQSFVVPPFSTIMFSSSGFSLCGYF